VCTAVVKKEEDLVLYLGHGLVCFSKPIRKYFLVIHARPLATYDAGSDEMPLKHLGFAKWPTIRGVRVAQSV
jgi:hypothetical protein